MRKYQLPALLAVYCAAIALARASTADNTEWQTWAVIASGAIVLWYTWETRELRLATIRQINNQMRPYVVMTPAGDGVELENVGSLPALNVALPDAFLDAGVDGYHLTFKFGPPVSVLRPGGKVVVGMRSYIAGVESPMMAAHMDPEYTNRSVPVTVTYSDVEGRAYALTHQVLPKGLVAGTFSSGAV
jgi:hypothetical protein